MFSRRPQPPAVLARASEEAEPEEAQPEAEPDQLAEEAEPEEAAAELTPVDHRAIELDIMGWKRASDATRWALEAQIVHAITEQGMTWDDLTLPLGMSVDEAMTAFGQLGTECGGTLLSYFARRGDTA